MGRLYDYITLHLCFSAAHLAMATGDQTNDPPAAIGNSADVCGNKTFFRVDSVSFFINIS
jgi:hypothetical protein